MERGCTVKISIIIPNFNKGDFIQKAIESIIAQEYKNWEAIVVDDGSSDNSIEIIKKFSGLDARVKLHRRERTPKGGSTCRNIGIENALGDYLIFFDSDDLMSPMCIGERVKLMEANLDLDFAIFPVGTFYKELGDSSMIWKVKKGNHLKQFLSHDLPWNIMSPIWKSTFIKKALKGFDESFPRLQDVEFHTRALLQPEVNYRVISKTSPKCFYRIDQDRTNQSSVEYLSSMLTGIELYIEKFEKNTLPGNYKLYLRSTLFTFLTLCNYYFRTMQITAEDHSFLVNQIINVTHARKVFKDTNKSFLFKYNKLYFKGLWHIKGFNYFSKQIWKVL